MQVITADHAASLIKDEWTLTIGGFGHCGSPEALISALERRYKQTNTPRALSLVFASAPGDRNGNGIDRLAHPGLISRIIGGFWSLAPKIGSMVAKNQIEAHNWPQGVISHLFRAIATGKPWVISNVGLGTFVDPALQGGCLNSRTATPLVERLDILGWPALMYRSTPLNCALLRGTRADFNGNITMEREANIQDVLAQAQAVRNSGGIVIVQVLEIAKAGSLPLNLVKIPGFLVDYVVIASPEDHWQTYGEQYNPAYSESWLEDAKPLVSNFEPFSVKRIIARRALLELKALIDKKTHRRPVVVNLGIGTPEMIAAEARSEMCSIACNFTLTVESGAIGGSPAGGMSFGATSNPDVVLTQAEQFDHYDGGGIDIAFLGFGQIDTSGHINVASLGDRLNGVGGFINISQSAKKLVFCGSFTTDGLKIQISSENELQILKEGRVCKLVEQVELVCYDPAGHTRCEDPLVITERAVMRLTKDGLEVIEVAPGIDIGRDIIARAGFHLRISDSVKLMPASVFGKGNLSVPFVS